MSLLIVSEAALWGDDVLVSFYKLNKLSYIGSHAARLYLGVLTGQFLNFPRDVTGRFLEFSTPDRSFRKI